MYTARTTSRFSATASRFSATAGIGNCVYSVIRSRHGSTGGHGNTEKTIRHGSTGGHGNTGYHGITVKKRRYGITQKLGRNGTKHQKLYEDLTEVIIGIAIEVHKTLGPGFKEALYKNTMIYELGKKGINFVGEKQINIPYKEITVGQQRLDLLVEDKIIVELKAVNNLEDNHLAQALSYLKATGRRVALLINFSRPKIEVRRAVL
jgi:GxxExxY protein